MYQKDGLETLGETLSKRAVWYFQSNPGETENVMETGPDLREQPRSHLFLVRLWQEQLDEDQTEWRGKVLYAHSGEEIYFRDWEGIVTTLQKMLDLSNPKPVNAASEP